MIRRFGAAAILSSFLLVACDGNSASSPNGTQAVDKTDLVGSWATETGDFSLAHMVLRADGTGKTVGEAGTRRDVYGIAWRLEASSLVLSRDTITRTIPIELHGDTLILLPPTGSYGGEARFVREPEPVLDASPGVHPAEMLGLWSRPIPASVNGTTRDGVTIYDTIWSTETFEFRGDGIAVNVGIGLGSVCDEDGHCRLEPLLDDTTVFEWWTGGNKLFVAMKSSGTLEAAGFTLTTGANAQVVDWARTGSDLELKARFYPYAVRRYGKAP